MTLDVPRGTTLLNLGQNIQSNVKFIGFDSSQEMLAKCRQKLIEHHFPQGMRAYLR